MPSTFAIPLESEPGTDMALWYALLNSGIYSGYLTGKTQNPGISAVKQIGLTQCDKMSIFCSPRPWSTDVANYF